jgi:hypothetical protein
MPKQFAYFTGAALIFAGAWVIGPITVEASAAAMVAVRKIQQESASNHARIIIALDAGAEYRKARLTNPDRIYFDISNATLSSDFQNRIVPVQSELLKKVRVAQNASDVVRVVFDISETIDYSVSELKDPFRIVIDLYPRSAERTSDAESQRSFRPQLKEPDPSVMVSRPGLPDAGPIRNRVPELLALLAVSAFPPSSQSDGSAQSSAPSESSPRQESESVVSSDPQGIAEAQAGKVVMPEPRLPAQPGTAQNARPPSPEMPLTVTGTLSSGFYNSYTRGGGNENQEISFIPASALFDINGYYLTPDLVDYWVQPEFNAGAQASDAGFQGGNGIRLRASFLKRQIIPVTFRYSNVQLKDVYFGSLSQVSSFTQKNRTKELGFSAELNRKNLPTVTVDWSKSSVHSQSGIDMIPDYDSKSDHLNVDGAYQRWGWDFRGFASKQRQVSDLIVPLSDASGSSALQQDLTQVRGSARRGFLRDSELYFDGGRQSTTNVLLNQPIDLNTRYTNANLRLFQRRRWKTSLRAGYTSNVAGLLLNRVVEGLGANGSIVPATNLLQPFQNKTSYLNLNGLTSVDLSHGFGFYGSVDRTAVLAGKETGLSSSYLTTAGGVTYAGTFGWGNISGQYGRTYGIGSITGQTGTIVGQNYTVSAQPGRWERLQLDFTVRGTDQQVRNERPAQEHSFAADGSIGFHLASQLRGRLGGGWQQSYFINSGNEFRNDGYTARIGIDHPRFQFSGSLNSNIGNSLQAYSQLFSGVGLGSALLAPLRIIPSDFRGIALSLHVLPMRRLELSALWTRSIQHLEGAVANDFAVLDVYATFHFRRLQFVAGYFGSAQIYTSYLALYPETRRGRIYVRLSRTIKFL